MEFANPSSALVVIGNGFDLMHGVKSSYWDFQKTIANLEDSLGRLNYSMFLDSNSIDMWLDDFGAYDPDAQAAGFFGAVETAIAPTEAERQQTDRGIIHRG